MGRIHTRKFQSYKKELRRDLWLNNFRETTLEIGELLENSVFVFVDQCLVKFERQFYRIFA
jgi:hypothetical protein